MRITLHNKRAEWIWYRPANQELIGFIPKSKQNNDLDRNRFVYFRKEFLLLDKPISAWIHASADGRYILFVNGIIIGRGPARCHPGWQYIDPYEISALLRSGRNTISALVHSYGRDTSWYETLRGFQAILFGCAGFYSEVRVLTKNGLKILDTDESWKFKQAESWKNDTAFGGIGFAEQFDAEKEPVGWSLPEFDDSSWENAYIQRIKFHAYGSDVVPFPHLVERDIAYLKTYKIYPLRIKVNRSETWQEGNSKFTCSEGEELLLIADFGRILLGRLHLEIEAASGSEIEFFYGESLNSNGLVFQFPAVSGIFNQLKHRVKFRDGRQEFTQFEATGFRYIQIAVRAKKRPLTIYSLGAEETKYPCDAPGEFTCSDEGLNKIWEAGAYTASICRQDGMIDCPTREQRQWTGDAYIQSLLNYVTNGDSRLVRKMLIQAAQTQRPDGMIMMASTCDLEVSGITYIPDYALLWIMAIEQYIIHTGDLDILSELFPTIAKAIDWFLPYINLDGLLENVPGWIFIDWSEMLDKSGEVLTLNAMFAGALDSASRLADMIGAPLYAKRWKKLNKTLRINADKAFWDESRGIYIDARTIEGLSEVASQQGNSAAIDFGIAPKEKWDRIFSAILDKKRIKLTRAWKWDIERPFNAATDIILAQPYFSHFLHQALGIADRIDDIVKNIKQRWMPMLKEGNTFWETWQISEITSRCHAFSATPTWDLSTYILGVKAIKKGFLEFKVKPYFKGLSWVKGKVPTPAGMIVVAWRRGEKMIEIEVQVPKGLHGTLEISDSDLNKIQYELRSGENNFVLS